MLLRQRTNFQLPQLVPIVDGDGNSGALEAGKEAGTQSSTKSNRSAKGANMGGAVAVRTPFAFAFGPGG